MDTIKDLESDRKCWRLLNGVLFEKPKSEVYPELQSQIQGMDSIVKQINETLAVKK